MVCSAALGILRLGMDIVEELLKVTQALEQAQIDYAVCGGLAVAIQRTKDRLDIEMLLDESD